jgi:hypothetical protein
MNPIHSQNILFQKKEEELISMLARYWKMSEEELSKPFKVIATFRKSEKKDKFGNEFGYFIDVRNLDGDILYYPMKLGKVSVFSRFKESFNTSNLWQINVRLAPRSQREKFNNPFMLIMDDLVLGKPKVQFLDKLKKEKLIKQIFEETGATSRDAKILSYALQKLMGDLYTKTERFIFELLQNADDQPIPGSLVYVTLKTLDDNLLFLHSGKPFSESDVDSISSIGDSTKKDDVEKTGYKGIGFKSVFSDAETVYISSGNFSFAFDKKSPLYAREKDMEIVPWQIKPIWVERYRLPKEVQEVPAFFNSNVAISLNVGQEKIAEYNEVISSLLSQPRFILFLRNVGRLRYESELDEAFEISKNYCDDIVRIQSSGNSEDWSIKDYIIPIPPETQEQLQNDKLVPKKLKDSTKTKITFAAQISSGNIITTEDTVLFTYLPTEVSDFEFKFLVNADFLTTASRETIHSKNIWNRFLFENIGRLLIDWIVSLSEYSGVICLLPTEEYIGDDLLKTNFFNSIKDASSQIRFIKGNDGELHYPNEIMVDKSGLSDILGKDIYCKLIDPNKYLPYYESDEDAIKRSKLLYGITHIDTDIVLEKLKNSQIIIDWFPTASIEDRNDLFNWIKEKNTKTRETLISEVIYSLPLFRIGDDPVSLKRIKDSHYIILSESISSIKDILVKLNFICTDDILEDNHPLSTFIQKANGGTIFDLIKNCNLSLLTSNERKELFNVIKDVSESQLKDIALFKNLVDNPTPLRNMAIFRENPPSWIMPYMICKDDLTDELISYLVPFEKEFAEIVWKNLESITIPIYEIYKYYKWTDQEYTKKLISKCVSQEDFKELLPIVVESAQDVKKEYIRSIKRIDLNAGNIYSKDSFEYKILKLVLEGEESPSIFAHKIYFDNKPIAKFSIKDDVICEWEENGNKKKATFSLAKILPEYADQSSTIDIIKDLFEVKSGLDRFFEAKAKPNKEIYDELNTKYNLYNGEPWPLDKTDNVYQYLFHVYYTMIVRGYTSSYVKSIDLKKVNSDFIIRLMNFCFENNLSIRKAPFTFRVKQFFINKYFGNNYLTEDEKLLHNIEEWAKSNEKRHKYISENGVKDGSAKEIRFRRMLIENQRIDYIEDLTTSDINNGLSFVCSKLDLTFPLVGDNQVETIKILSEKTGVNIKRYINLVELSSLSREWDSSEYTSWIQNHYPHIYFYDGNMPYFLDYGNIHICEISSDKDYYYEPSSKKLYINSNVELTPLLFSLVTQQGIPFDTNDYRILCMDGKVTVSKDEIAAKNEEIESLKSRVEELERLLNGRNVHIGGTSSGLSKKDQYAALIEAQQALKSKRPDWNFPIGFGERNDDGTPSCFTVETVQNEEGNNMEIVIKSYKKTDERFHINPEEWEAVVKRRAKLLVYTYFKGELDIVEIPKDELVRKQSSIQISFDTSNLDEEKYPNKISEFASILRYFQQITFDFNQFHISKDAVKVKDITSKRDLTITSAEDEDI